MHAIFAVIMLTVGADSSADQFSARPAVAGAQPAPVMVRSPGPYLDVPEPYHYDPPRDPQEADDLVHGFFNYCRAWFEPMPQTCYSPHFGCYPGNGRDITRYPAFHGYYYRQAYNYRPLFEYPWQADMHEPLPLEISSERSLASNPRDSQPEPVEVIQTPAPNRPPRMP